MNRRRADSLVPNQPDGRTWIAPPDVLDAICSRVFPRPEMGPALVNGRADLAGLFSSPVAGGAPVEGVTEPVVSPGVVHVPARGTAELQEAA